MDSVTIWVEKLSARLPELEWMLAKVPSYLFQTAKFPRQLFRHGFPMTPDGCMADIRHDLARLETHANPHSARFLADNINQKISALIRVCQVHVPKSPTQANPGQLDKLATRDEWMYTLKQTVAHLKRQEAAFQALPTASTRAQEELTMIKNQRRAAEAALNELSGQRNGDVQENTGQ